MSECPMPAASHKTRRALAAAVAVCAWGDAHAETPNPLPEWYYSQGHLLDAHIREGDAPTWSRVVGLSAEESTKYEGGNAYTTTGGPSFDLRYRDIAFLSAGEGLGVNLLHSKDYRAGVALNFDLGRRGDDDHHLSGLDAISISPESVIYGEYLLFPVTFRVDVRHSFGGQGGWIGDVSVYSPLAGSKKYFIFAGPSLTFANHNNMRHNFGVSASESLNSGYPRYNAGSGLRSGAFGVSGGYFLTQNWLLTGMLAAEQLFGGAGHSPFVQEQGQLAATFTVAYRW